MSDTPKEARIARKMEQIERVTSRRRFLQATAATGILAGLGMSASAQAQTFRLGGEVSEWTGRAPSSIEGQSNPTLRMEPGQDYVIVWENVDGQPHNVVIEDADGNDIVRSEIVSGRGETQRVEFTAEEQMAEYYCEVHPTSMRGQVQTGGGGTTSAQTTESDQGGPGFFEQGTQVGIQQVAGGMTAPTAFAAPDGDDRRFVADQTGQVWTIGPDGNRQDQPFIDVQDRMVTLGEFNGQYADPEQEYDERGLLGIAFHPNFSDNRQFYLHYSAPPNQNTPNNWDHVEVVSEFTASDDGSSGNPDSERKLLQMQSPQYNHDAGPIAFGPDGYLYVPMGDGGGADDNMYGHVQDWYDRNDGGNGQDVEENLLGGIIRIDVDNQQGNKPYAIPDDNPFAGDGPGLPEMYAWGLRNPFGISFDSQGQMFIATAGQNLYEAAYIVENGSNCGWNVKEGSHCFSTENPTDPPRQCPNGAPADVPGGGGSFTEPIVEYPHTYNEQSVGITIIGGHRYEQNTVSGLQGKYVFGDWTKDPGRERPAGRILAARPRDGGAGGTATTEADGGTETTEAAGMGAGAQETTETTEAGTTQAGTTQAGGDHRDIPLDQLWQMEELVVAGSDDGTLDHFVRQFGRDNDGELYVLANKRGVPQGNSGVLLKIVPPGEGDFGGGTGTTQAGTTGAETTAAGETVTETGEPGGTTEGQ